MLDNVDKVSPGLSG